MELRGKRVTVVGMARSGVGAARLLSALGAAVTLNDRRQPGDFAGIAERLPSGVALEFGGHPDRIFREADLIVVSPGVPLETVPISDARERGVPVIGELELAYRVARDRWAVPFLAITGSNGKSTTTSLLDGMMRKDGRRTILGGNIGNALTEEFAAHLGENDLPADFVVAEVSSFQLEAVAEFRPKVAALLNVTPDHLDRYHSMDEYADAKARIFAFQTPDDFLVLNADDPAVERLRERISGRPGMPTVVSFSRTRAVTGVFLRNGTVHADLTSLGRGEFPVIRASDILIKGVHNLENAMAASAMALLAGCSVAAVGDTLREFPGLEHRLEFVRERRGVRYINDSKGTNVGAVEKSLESFDQPLVLIAGGRDKAGDFTALRPLVPGRVKALVLIGEAAGKIREALGDLTATVMADSLRDAVLAASQIAAPGETVLLSPACASFDMFADFEDRGRQFKAIVGELDA